jgi:hypothetical protein
MTTREQRAQRILDGLRQTRDDRAAKGLCRHCGGPVPCYSGFGDSKPGVLHTKRTLRARIEAEKAAIWRQP